MQALIIFNNLIKLEKAYAFACKQKQLCVSSPKSSHVPTSPARIDFSGEQETADSTTVTSPPTGRGTASIDQSFGKTEIQRLSYAGLNCLKVCETNMIADNYIFHGGSCF